MNSMTIMTSDMSAQVQRSVARSIGKSACIYAYPLLELLRMCRLQTTSRYDLTRSGLAAIDTLHHSDHPPTERSLIAAGPARLYTTAWIFLGDGPRHLHLPAGWLHMDHRVRATLYDAHTERIGAFGWHDSHPLPADVLLVGPRSEVSSAPDGHLLVRSSTDMAYLVAHVDIDESDRPGAFELQAEIVLDGRSGTFSPRRPPAVDLWDGDGSDPFVDIIERDGDAAEVAPRFYANLCRALAHARARPEARHLVASFRHAGLEPGDSLDWGHLPLPVRQGLVDGLADAVECIREGSRDRQSFALLGALAPECDDRCDYAARALASYKGSPRMCAEGADVAMWASAPHAPTLLSAAPA